MARENFYILLDLSLDPPEADPEKIEEAIKKKQSEWSRMRNHPTKGIQVQHYIGMIPEIRKVMMDSSLREAEAKAALEVIESEKVQKFSGIDRHIEIRMSKGFITDEEIEKLANMHNISMEEIRERIEQKEKEKYAEVDKHIRMRMSKGYITEEELAKIANLHGLDEEMVRKRVRGPIKKEGKSMVAPAKPLDPAIEKVISDNLQLVGKSSLYDFLGLSPDSDIQILQNRAKEKEVEVLKIRKKDAMATASGVLVGHCISVFKSDKSRASYDVSRARAHLAELNSDIDVAGMDGIIRAEYFEMLVKRAAELGMDPDEASEHIRQYCEQKKWKIEDPSKKKAKPKSKVRRYLALLVLALLVAGIYYGTEIAESMRIRNEYENMVARVESLDNPSDKITVLTDYIINNRNNRYVREVKARIEQAKDLIEKKKFDQAIKEADGLTADGKLEEAKQLYVQFLDRNPKKELKKEINQRLAQLENLMERRDYQELGRTLNLSTVERIAAYRNYLEKHPEGENRQNVMTLLSDLGDAYYVTLMDELAECEREQTYERCIRLAESFIEVYPEDERSRELSALQEKYKNAIRETLVLNELRKKAREKGEDFEAAKQIFLNYLQYNPETTIRDGIEKELTLLEQKKKEAQLRAELRERAKKLREAGGRYVADESKKVITDTKTGLMWTLFDSTVNSSGCMNYEDAEKYVENLTTGGFRDWRIPTARELRTLYKTEPFFPFAGFPWYWTSENYKSYADGWILRVDVVTTKGQVGGSTEQMDSRECGAVRAVRP